MATEYLFWYAVFIIPSALNTVLMGFCRNDSSPVLVSVATMISTACNIFGDWLLIFPIPMGLKGAAVATGLSQTLSLLIVLAHYLLRKGNLYFHLPKLDQALFKKIMVRGLPESISQLATPVMTLCMNMVLVQHMGDIGVNAFSIISYVASFSIAVFLGSSEGLQPLFGQSYGAKQPANKKSIGKAVSAKGDGMTPTNLSVPFCDYLYPDISLAIYCISANILKSAGYDNACSEHLPAEPESEVLHTSVRLPS